MDQILEQFFHQLHWPLLAAIIALSLAGLVKAAVRAHLPESIIAATLAAFGTSLPELVTAMSAARRGHGDLAVGNIVGADILNVLFVSGAAAAVTPSGVSAGPYFFRVLFPIMIFIPAVFRGGGAFSGKQMKRPFGAALPVAHAVYLLVSYLVPSRGF